MNFELVISGLCVIAMKASKTDEIPKHPDAVDIIFPNVPMHCPRLSYLPGAPIVAQVEPDMAIDNMGRRVASLNIAGAIPQISFSSNPSNVFSVRCVPEPGPKEPPPGDLINFVPRLHELCFDGFTMPADGKLPSGASARITLPKGEIFADDIVNDPNTGNPVLWDFKCTPPFTRALANHVVYRAMNVGDLKITWRDGQTVLDASDNHTVSMSVSNDDCLVPRKYNDPVEVLKDLTNLSVLGLKPNPTFCPPVKHASQRTGRPICNQVIVVYN